jgi:hypothetical protein
VTAVHKVGLGFVAAGIVLGVAIPALGFESFGKPLTRGLLFLCFVTIFALAYRERTKRPR